MSLTKHSDGNGNANPPNGMTSEEPVLKIFLHRSFFGQFLHLETV